MNPYIRYKSKEIDFPKKITIVLPFENAEEKTAIWARSEEKINFDDIYESSKCTLSFAALEIWERLTKFGASVAFSSKKSDGFNICLAYGGANKRNCDYSISFESNSLLLVGESRVGTLYAAYTFLNAQGYRWLYPGAEGEIVPKNLTRLAVPAEKTYFSPSMKDGRSLDLFAPLKDSRQFILWMARNRMNVSAEHPHTSLLCKKLGMTTRIGGHLFKEFLLPDLVLENGETIWNSHRDWYGLPIGGERIKKRATKNQFCMSNESLCDYLANIIIGKLRGEWKSADIIDVWGFDNASGSACQCDGCRALGNDSDQTLHFISELRKRIDRETDLRPVTLLACAYEGTKTMDAPTRPVPKNLLKNDAVAFFPIHRCYHHNFNDKSCKNNTYFDEKLKGWAALNPPLPIMMGEYYNVSKYEDLPLVFKNRMASDIPHYKKSGVTMITYMHPPVYNWGVRALNHLLLAELSFDINANVSALVEDYFSSLYGKYAKDAEKIYELIEDASGHVSSYRNWWHSVLESLLQWDGKIPTKMLDLTDHFKDHAELIERLELDLSKKREALAISEKIISKLKNEEVAIDSWDAMNPLELSSLVKGTPLMNRLTELRRSFIYAVDENHLFSLVVKMYDLRYRGLSDDELWEEIEEVHDKMAGYFYPHVYAERDVEAYCADALRRTQLQNVIARARRWKISKS